MRVLYVEDNATDADLVRLSLQRVAPHVVLTVARSIAEARARLASEGPSYDAALIDMRLPDGDGLAVLSAIRERALPLATVVVTGMGDEETAVAVLKAGADDYVVKQHGFADTLPLVLEDAVGRFRAECRRTATPLRVLYTEHNAIDVDLTRRHLSRHAPHITLDIARSAEEALRKLGLEPGGGHRAGGHDVILLDYRLPGTNALEMLKEIRETRALDVPVVLVTGQGHEDIALQALRLGAADYVPKNPGYLFQLPGVLENAWYKARLTREREALRQSEERFRLLAENAQDLIYRYRFMPQRGFEYVSPSATAMTGYTPEEHYADPELGLKLVHPEDRHLLEQADAGGAITLRWVRRDGTIIWTEQRNVPVRDSAGNVVALQGIARDITERRRAEEKLIQAQKMEAVGRLTAGVAHDFNNLLTAINGFTEFAQLKLAAGDPVRELLAKVLEAGRRAGSLVHQLLAFSRRQAAQPVVVDLAASVSSLEKMLRRIIGEDVEFATRAGQKVWPVRVDPTQFEQVVLNLVVNSRDAMPAGGKLTISVENRVLDEQGPVEGLPAGDYVAVAITDTGTGMSDEVKAHLFEPFFTTKEQGKGTGLGLATVYGIVQQNHGGLRVDSAPGAGSTFTVYLPRCEEARAAGTGAGEAAPRGGNECILVVEDDAGVRGVVVATLRSLGYAVREAVSGTEAIAMLDSDCSPVTLLLTDMVMPGMSGIALAEEVRRRDPRAKVLFMTGYSEEALARRESGTGDFPVLQKPFTVNALGARIREVLDAPRESR